MTPPVCVQITGWTNYGNEEKRSEIWERDYLEGTKWNQRDIFEVDLIIIYLIHE